jgi:hypothetical protein
MSSPVVDQFGTENRIAGLPCQLVPPSQQVPSCWTRSITAAGSAPGPEEHLVQHHVVKQLHRAAAASSAAASRASAQHRSINSATPRRPGERRAAYTGSARARREASGVKLNGPDPAGASRAEAQQPERLQQRLMSLRRLPGRHDPVDFSVAMTEKSTGS